MSASEQGASSPRARSEPPAGDAGHAQLAAAAGLTGDAAREVFPAFVEESLDCLAQAEHALLAIETDANDGESVNVALRAFHTIKGSAAFLGFDAISKRAHDAESLLIPVRDGNAAFGQELADTLLKTADGMRSLLAQARAGAGDDVADASDENGADVGAANVRDARPTAASDDDWTRVRTRRLDELVDLIGELVVAQTMVAQDPEVQRDRHGPLAAKALRTTRIVRELQALGIGLRMVPLRPVFQRLQRLVRDLARQSDKQIELVTAGEETEIDRTMVDVLADPLVHMIRNAVDHALETQAERIAAGKPANGTLRLTASHAGGAVVVELQDDGRGMDRERILRKAVERGIVTSGQELTDAEIDALIFAPGLSTAGRVTELSGRGVGMDVVQRNIEVLRGRVEIASTPGLGTTFTLRLPLTLAVTDGLLVGVGSERYVVPTFAVVTSFRPAPAALVREASGGELVMLHGRPVPVLRLHHVFGIANAETDPTSALLVVIADGQERFALLVDRMLGHQQFVAKPLAHGLGTVTGVAGSAVLGDGRVGLIIDPPGLLARARQDEVWRGEPTLIASP